MIALGNGARLAGASQRAGIVVEMRCRAPGYGRVLDTLGLRDPKRR
jgi:hypothetical protein